MRVDHETLLRAAMAAWPAEESSYLNGWYLRFSADPAKRTNAVWPVSFTGCDELDEMILAVERWYHARSRPALFQVNDRAMPAGLDGRLDAKGYRAFDHSAIEILPLPPGQTIDRHVVIETRARPWVMQAILPPQASAAHRSSRAGLFAKIRKPLAFALAFDNDAGEGQPVAGGMVVVDGALAGIFNMHTHAAWRGQGFASAVLARLCQWAYSFGARQAYLQVELANQAARNFYRRRGFERCLDYHYRTQLLVED